jgi:hypothetical protein
VEYILHSEYTFLVFSFLIGAFLTLLGACQCLVFHCTQQCITVGCSYVRGCWNDSLCIWQPSYWNFYYSVTTATSYSVFVTYGCGIFLRAWGEISHVPYHLLNCLPASALIYACQLVTATLVVFSTVCSISCSSLITAWNVNAFYTFCNLVTFTGSSVMCF